ncbi:sialate O-acetylesterase [Cerasicoccus frondis]|uniref:sialate O-acetylesterase n=1 Tax=Cerasicoccus frondis TaxID=490090 RepID=UPI002852BCDB|nr:sialate O-acetylesterase [Cerasicoccus frondis]
MSTILASTSGEDSLDLFILAGTSNMQGDAAFVSELPDELRVPNTRVLIYQNDTWTPLQAGVSPKKAGRNFGPEITFGDIMSRHFGKPIGIIQTKLTAVSDTTGYQKILDQVKSARRTRSIRVKGLVLQAGERDGNSKEHLENFKQNIITLINLARNDFENPKLPVIINLAIPKPDRWPFVLEIRKIENDLIYPGFAVINCDSLPQAPDGIHYTTEGELEFGRLLANGLIQILNHH